MHVRVQGNPLVPGVLCSSQVEGPLVLQVEQMLAGSADRWTLVEVVGYNS